MSLVDLIHPASALFLDFDGTLVDIAAQPEGVVVPADLVDTLRRLADRLGGAVAVVSGRPIVQIDRFLSPLRLPAAGVHGTERRSADGRMAEQPTPSLDAVQQAADALAREHPLLRIEAKRGALALHYRQAPGLEALCVEAMQAAVDRSPGLTLLRGKMVAEAKPASASKGEAITAFLREPPFAGRVPVFIGDDVTDEAGFIAVQSIGGAGVKVGAGATAAQRRLQSPEAMRAGLQAALTALTAMTEKDAA